MVTNYQFQLRQNKTPKVKFHSTGLKSQTTLVHVVTPTDTHGLLKKSTSIMNTKVLNSHKKKSTPLKKAIQHLAKQPMTGNLNQTS
jgi:hypothetical protein